MLTMNKIKSILRQTNRHVRLDQFLDEKKYILCSIVLIGLFIVFMLNSFAVLEPVSSITVKSTTLDYSKSEEGSWKYTKTAKWISKGKARINIKLETKEMLKSDYTDVILVLDTSGSMLGDKLIQVQTDINNLINDTIPKGNKIALITFNDTATIINDFTDDALVLQESINNLTASGETNYYQALVKADEILSTYTKEDNRNCVVLFLTDGLPTLETPSEVGEYKLLKEKYDYLDINGIQYELGDTILTGIKNITDNQFIANTKNLKRFLYKAVVGTENYEKLVLTDYVDTNYFNLDNITDITTSSGTASIKEDKVIWNLDGLKSGVEAELTIDINLNNDLIGVGGVYPTHTKTDLYYKIGTASVTETTDKTTVLKDNYVVVYEPNTPTGCIVSGIPSSKVYSVFDIVRLDESVPTCTGYQFKEWKIVTYDVEKVGNNQFIMPESNVKIKAIWKKVELVKSMNGKISNAQTLYKLIADNSSGVDTDVDFSKSPTDSDSGIYTINSTKSDKYPVHYYRGNITNNNVLFAGFCWKMVRTTSTGGVKLIYNGVPTDYSESTPISQDKYINILNDETYPYTYDLTTNKWTSTNKINSKTGTISFSVSEPGTYILSYSVSSEANFDKAYFYKDGTQIGVYSGTASGILSLGEITPSSVIMVKYTKDSSGSSGTDTVTFSIDKAIGELVKSCNNTGTSSQIGETRFNGYYTSPSDVGYMYGTRYTFGQYNPGLANSVLIQNRGDIYTPHYYSTEITYSSSTGKYTLQNAIQKSWSDNYSKLKGYYTCSGSLTACSRVYYIVNTDNTFKYSLALESGDIDPATQIVSLGKGVRDNGDSTYTLTDVVTVKRTDWAKNYKLYKDYYICKDLTSTTCDGKYRVLETNNYQITYDRTFNFLYGNDVTWDGTKYTLANTFVSTNTWFTDREDLAKSYHYTCFDTSGECTKVYYIHYFGMSSSIYYLTLSSGNNIENAKDEMFENTINSTIKQSIDTWYKNNMIAYTEKLEDTIWCNDRTFESGSLVGKDFDAGSSLTDYPHFSAYNRIRVLYSPSVECANESRDGFTVSTESGGNGVLTYPIGLLTADEMMLAGANYSSNSKFYLYTGGRWFASMSPSVYNYSYGSYGPANVFYIDNDGKLDNYYSVGSNAVRPAISLARGIRAIGGDGTVNNPFVVGDE